MYRCKTSPKTKRKPTRKIVSRNWNILKFMVSFVLKTWEMRYFCFCLFKAEKINIFLLWGLFIVSLGSFYWIEYTKNEDIQWYIYFSSQQFYMLIQSYIIWNCYKHTPHSAITTALLVKGIFSFLAEILGINNKYTWVNTAWQVLMFALLLLAIKTYLRRARKTN